MTAIALRKAASSYAWRVQPHRCWRRNGPHLISSSDFPASRRRRRNSLTRSPAPGGVSLTPARRRRAGARWKNTPCAAAPHSAKIEVEATTLAEVREALRAGAEVILLDNMTPAQIRAAVTVIGGAAVVEVSGGVRYETLRDFALPGVDIISIGALTHSAPAVDLSLTILPVRLSK